MEIKNFLERLEEIPEEFRRGEDLSTFEIGEKNLGGGELWTVTPRELEFIKRKYKEEFDKNWVIF